MNSSKPNETSLNKNFDKCYSHTLKALALKIFQMENTQEFLWVSASKLTFRDSFEQFTSLIFTGVLKDSFY